MSQIHRISQAHAESILSVGAPLLIFALSRGATRRGRWMRNGRIGVRIKQRVVRALTGVGRAGSELGGKLQCVRPTSQGEVRAGEGGVGSFV